MKNKKLTEKFGIHEGDRVRLTYHGDYRNETINDNGVHELCGTVYQIYQDFVVIMTRYGTHPSFPWSDFLKWRVE